jgi:hypothetical protein
MKKQVKLYFVAQYPHPKHAVGGWLVTRTVEMVRLRESLNRDREPGVRLYRIYTLIGNVNIDKLL